MPTKYEPSEARPYKIGHKIRILLGKNQPGNHTTTFGSVVKVSSENIPKVRYRDYSGLPLSGFDRVVKREEVEMEGEFVESKWKY